MCVLEVQAVTMACGVCYSRATVSFTDEAGTGARLWPMNDWAAAHRAPATVAFHGSVRHDGGCQHIVGGVVTVYPMPCVETDVTVRV